MTRELSSRRPILAGAAVFLLLTVIIIGIAAYHHLKIMGRLAYIAEVTDRKAAIISDMNRIVRERSLRMFAIYFSNDPFERDDEFMRFNGLAQQFIQLREQLVALGLSQQERAVMRRALKVIRATEPLQVDIVDQLMAEQKTGELELLIQQDIPQEDRVTEIFDEFSVLQHRLTQDYLEQTEQEYTEFLMRMAVSILLAILVAAGVTRLTLRRALHTEAVLHEKRMLAETTLHMISEGVLTLGIKGEVQDANETMQRLLSRSLDQLRGHHVGDILKSMTGAEHAPLDICWILKQLHGPAMLVPQKLRLVGADGHEYMMECTVFPICDQTGRPVQLTLMLRDVTYHHSLEERISWEAVHDPLTGIMNRRGFVVAAEALLGRKQQAGHALLYIDLDYFKAINDECGHAAGDSVLKDVVGLFKGVVRHNDILARLGGDEFVMLLEDCSLEVAKMIATKLISTVTHYTFVWGGKRYRIGASVGVLLISGEAESFALDELVEKADTACYQAKRAGRNQAVVVQP